MKRILALMIMMLMAGLVIPAVAMAADSPIQVYIDGEKLSFQQHPFVEKETTLVQFRPIFEKLGLEIHWDAATQTVTGTREGLEMKLVLNQKTAVVNGTPVELPIAPKNVNGYTFVPLRFVSETGGKEVKWYDEFRIIQIGEQLDAESLYLASLKDYGPKLYVIRETKTTGYRNYNKFGYINKDGKVIIPPQFEYARDFSEGFAVVHLGIGDTMGFIDTTGKLVLKSQYYVPQDFSNGIALVLTDNPYEGPYIPYGKPRYIKPNGETVFVALTDTSIYEMESFSEGLAPVKLKDGYGFIDRDGKVVIPAQPQYTKMYGFHDGLAKVEKCDEYGDCQYGYIDKSGKEVIPLVFAGAENFSEGLAAVGKDGKLGFIDQEGHLVIPYQYDMVRPFHNGLAAVHSNGVFTSRGQQYNFLGFIDKQGNFVVKPKFDATGVNVISYQNGMALFIKDGLKGYMNMDGEIVIPPRFVDAGPFSEEGIARVEVGYGEGPSYINKNGEFIWRYEARY